MPKIKGCPFCGAPAEAHNAFPEFECPWIISCEHDDGCPLREAQGMIACETTEEAAAAIWNRRASDAKLEAAVKALEEIRDHTNADDPESYRSDDREGCLDAVFSVADNALSQIKESDNG